MFLKFVLHIAYSNYIFLLSQIKILHIECPYYICLFDCHLFFQQGLPCLVDAFSPRLRNHLGIPGWVFCLRRNFHSLPLVRVLSFFYAQGTLPLLLCSSQARCLFSPSRVCQNFWFMRGGWIRGFLINSAKKIYFHTSGWLFEELLGSLSFSGPDPEAFYWGCSGSHLFQWELFSFSSCFPHLLSTSHRLFEDHL